jgi:vancomycin resistance protein YoaR
MAIESDEFISETTEPKPKRHRVLRLLSGIFIVGLLLVGSFELVYAGKIYPGVSVDGIYVGGMTKAVATARINDKIQDFSGHSLAITYGQTTLRIPVNDLGVAYSVSRGVNEAYAFGRTGGWTTIAHAHARSLIGRSTNIAEFTYADTRLFPYLSQVDDDLTQPVINATLAVSDNQAKVVPATSGTRLDIGRLTQAVEARLATTDIAAIAAPTYALKPTITTSLLAAATHTADIYLSGPITVTYNDITKAIDPSVMVSWLKVTQGKSTDLLTSYDLANVYPVVPPVAITLDNTAVAAYVAQLATHIDQQGQNAALSVVDGRATIFQPSRDGISLDQASAIKAIVAAASKPDTDRTVVLAVNIKKPDVNEANLNDLGINELISEGETEFPGSPSSRLTNVRIGAQQFNGILLKPDQVFSFGALLGAVGPEQGYVPGLVILGNHEEKQYGGGLCQVSSTAFRAALNAGLPIVARTNHSFAISYYTAPYGVPGVDATIYYPQVDFQFKNDTGHYILIQTVMQGSTLKFDFYGTKTKSGVIRNSQGHPGPEFVTGTNDATLPSHTVFWRDVLDLTGNVIKTDRFDTYYKSSLDFPITPQLN